MLNDTIAVLSLFVQALPVGTNLALLHFMYIYAGERDATARPRGPLSRAESARAVRCRHAPGLGSFSEGRVAHAQPPGCVVRTCHRVARLAAMKAIVRYHGLLASIVEALSEPT